MATDIERQFFDTFGIEPKEYCERIYQDSCFKNCPLYSVRKTDECFKYIEAYPQITDRILLRLICIWNNACLYLEDSIAPTNYQKVTETVLEYFVDIENYRFDIGKQEIKQQVQALFKE